MYYQVIEEPSAARLITAVSELVEEKGWVPQGGVAVTPREGSAGELILFYAQALIKDDD